MNSTENGSDAARASTEAVLGVCLMIEDALSAIEENVREEWHEPSADLFTVADRLLEAITKAVTDGPDQAVLVTVGQRDGIPTFWLNVDNATDTAH